MAVSDRIENHVYVWVSMSSESLFEQLTPRCSCFDILQESMLHQLLNAHLHKAVARVGHTLQTYPLWAQGWSHAHTHATCAVRTFAMGLTTD